MDEFYTYLINHDFSKAKHLLDSGYDINSCQILIDNDDEKISNLIASVLDKNVLAVEFLIQNQANLKQIDKEGHHALFYALSLYTQKHEIEHLKIAQLILNTGFKLTGETFTEKVCITLSYSNAVLELLTPQFENIVDWSNIDSTTYENFKISFEKYQLDKSLTENISHKKPKKI